MKFPCTLKNALLTIRDRFGLSFASKGLGYLAALLLLLSLLARYKLSCYQTTQLLTISTLADTTLLKTTCHFLLLLLGFDTLTYRKELQFIPYTCGSSETILHRGTSDQTRDPGAQDISTMVKQVQQDLPACRHPDSSRAYLVSGHDRIVQNSGRPNPELPLAVTGG